MTIEEKTVYITRGRQFDSQEKAEAHRADLLGEFMDKAPLVLSPGQRIKLNEFMVKHRNVISHLLDF